MDYSNLKGRYFGNDTLATQKENGMWDVTVIIKERLTDDGVNWSEESIGFTATDPDFQTAHKLALTSCLQVLQELVYGKGFDSLIQGIEHQKELEAKAKDETAASVENNEDTYVQ